MRSNTQSPAMFSPERRPRVRFDVGKIQLLVVFAALLLLAALLFLSGVAIGLLINPRLSADGSLLQSALLPRRADPPLVLDDTYQSGGETPPRSLPAPQAATAQRQPTPRPELVPRPAFVKRSLTSSPSTSIAPVAVTPRQFLAQDDLDSGPVVWRPRSQRQLLQRAAPRVDEPKEPVASPQLKMAEIETVDEPLTQIVDATYQPRGVSSWAQPPARWSRAQPLAAAYLVTPEGDLTAPAADLEGVGDSVEIDDIPLITVPSPSTEAVVTDLPPASVQGSIPAVSVAPSSVAASATAASKAVDNFTAAAVNDDEPSWQPSSSHWQGFYDSLAETTVDPSLADRSSTTAEPVLGAIPGATSLPVVNSLEVTQSAQISEPATVETSRSANSPQLSAMPETGQDLDSAAAEDGWQPSTSLWQSFLESPHDWTPERIVEPPSRDRRGRHADLRAGYGLLVDRMAAEYGLDPSLVMALIEVESAFDARALSHKGARGLMQVMPATASRFGIDGDSLYEPEANLTAGLSYLAWLRDRFDGDAARVLAAYNAGESAVDKYGGIPPFSETRRYVERIYKLMDWPAPR